MENVLYNAALLGNISFLNDARNNELESGGIDEYFLRQTSHKNNILHLAIPRDQFEFIEVVVSKGLISKQAIHELIKQTNEDGNTPIHVASEVGNMDIFRLLYDIVHGEMVQEERSAVVTKHNAKGNTPLHVALIHGKYVVAKLLIENHPNMAVGVANNLEETPLHVATTHQPIFNGDVPIKKRKATSSAYLGTIKLLLEKESCIACSRDKTGATPLHRAASITSAYNLQIIKLILDHCPQSAELRDASSKTILHLLKMIPSYKQGKDLLGFPEIFGLMNHQDLEGNTPLHTAAMNMNLNMVRALVDSSANQSIRNKDGISASSLIHEQFEQTVEKNQMTVEVCEAIDRANISFLREKMHNFGNSFLFSRDSKRRNVLHKLMHISNGTPVIPNDFVDFIEEVLESFPAFIGQVDLNGDTPLHILMRNSPGTLIRYVPNSNSNDYTVSSVSDLNLVLKLLELCCTYFDRYKEEASSKGVQYDLPWLVQNSEGNTPLHEALIKNQDAEVVEKLLDLDINTTARLTNKVNETPLHLAAGIFDYENRNVDIGFIDNLAEAYKEAADTHDKNGLTPLLRAAQSGNVITILKLLKYFPHSAITADEKCGQTMWHLVIQHTPYCTWYLCKSHSDFKRELVYQNYEGNTPLHLAIQGGRFTHAINFLQDMETEMIYKLLERKNNAGVTPSDLIRSSQEIPEELEKILRKDRRFIGYRSVYGIATDDMNEYVNTIGVIAALLMTITFTAAFTVPGGAIQDTDKNDKGSPILVNDTAFQVFMVFDILTMSLSTMVLFCLLWILAAGTKRSSMMLLDTSILLLLISFYTTLLTFMAGVYATTIYVKPWIAIYTIVICSSLMVLMRKFLVVNYIGYVGPILSFYTKMVIDPHLHQCKKKDETK